MNEKTFKDRTRKLALRVIRLVNELPNHRSTLVLGKQLLRSATSIGANYRAACRGKSKADVVAKLSIVEEEADETAYWLELLVESGLVQSHEALELLRETNEIIAMTVASIKTLRSHQSTQNQKSKF